MTRKIGVFHQDLPYHSVHQGKSMSYHLIFGKYYPNISTDPDLFRAVFYIGAVLFFLGTLISLWASFKLPSYFIAKSKKYKGKKTPQERQKMLREIFLMGTAALFFAAVASIAATSLIPLE